MLDEEHIKEKGANIEKNTERATEIAIQKALSMVNQSLIGVQNFNFSSNPAARKQSNTSVDLVGDQSTGQFADKLPPVGDFSIIKDLVKDYTELSKVQEVERRKHERISLRAYHGN